MRSRSDRWLAGVLGGMAKNLGCSPLLLRVLFLLIGHAFGLGILAYLVLWIVMPLEPEA